MPLGAISSLPYSCTNNTGWLDNSIKEAASLSFHHHHSSNFSSSSFINITVITNCIFTKNEASRKEGRGGAIAMRRHYYTKLNHKDPVIHKSNVDHFILRNSTLCENSAAIGGGIYSYSSRIFIATTDFQQNSAQLYGGGISSETSWVCFEGKVHFISNVISNSGKGGAVYSDNKCEVNLCPILWANNTKLNFTGNSAAHGPILYGGMLDRCDNLPGRSLKAVIKTLIFYGMDSYKWSSKAITSLATNFCFRDNCIIRTKKEVIYPGQSFNVTVGCLDQLKQPLNYCLVQSEYDSAHYQLGSGENKRIINGYENLTFQLSSNRKGSTLLTMSSDISCKEDSWKKLVIAVKVKMCPLGFQLQNQQCDCDNRLLKTSLNIKCCINNEMIILADSGWLSYKEGFLRVHFDCPLDYCLKNKKHISPLQPDVQCANSRGGVLCGGCLANYSVVLGS